MGISIYPAAASSKTSFKLSLLSGTSWTVPTNCTSINATLIGAGGGGAGIGGTAATGLTSGGVGGNTTMTGATTALGGTGTTANGAQASTSLPWSSAGVAPVANSGVGGPMPVGSYSNSTTNPTAGLGMNMKGGDGQVIISSFATTPGASITYSIGAGGSAGNLGTGGLSGTAGASGRIDIEYWA